MNALSPSTSEAAPPTGGPTLTALLREPVAADPARASRHDELHDAHGRPRASWERFFDWLPADPTAARAELDARAAQLARQIRADGITHNVYGADAGGRGPARPWPLEVLPLIVEPDDWAVIERGVVQRARLLNAMMADLYGAQRLLHDALLPAALLFRHPGYLRPLHGVVPPGGLFLHIVAFDLARGPDGHWWVVAQRCENPSGLGYVLHNRLTVSRLFPEAFRELRVQHIASSYRRLLDTVEAQAAQVAGGESPRLALLTSGPYSETYFEHAYLARYLGVPLVEGGDLTVRDDRVYLKTVEGLKPVHALLRRLDDQWCDPLELRADSTLGVPALLQAVRVGRVVVANALGSACLETPALQGFLPAISRALLGEELAMPSLPTWWCGEPAAWQAVRGALDDKVVRHTFPRRPGAPASGAPTIEAIEADPDAWTVQGRLAFSCAPLWRDGAIHTRPAGLRVYAIADGHGRWHALPGGMTRVAAGVPTTVSMQRGGTSMDTWVLTDGPVDLFSMLPQRLGIDDILARRRPVASRTAENLFWLGRYTERTEQLVRLARATLTLIDSDTDAPPALLDAVSVLARDSGLAPAEVPGLARAPAVFERSVLAALTDTSGAFSIGFNLAALARAAGSLRERLSTEHWGLVQAMGEDFHAAFAPPPSHTRGVDALLAPPLPSAATALPALDRLAVQLAAVTGAQSDRMTRDHGWRLLTVGRFIERVVGLAQSFATLLDLAALDSEAGLELALELFDSTITYRARYQRHQDLLAVVDTLVLDEANPRAFAGMLRRLRIELRKLPGPDALLDAWVARLPAEGAGLSIDELRSLHGDASEAALRWRLRALAHQLAQAGRRLSDDLGSHYFAHAGTDVPRRV
ncbi:circularly permuted type 2 ATP-grasp protein [Azohydromonas sediminis]|uniref:circularly permuted type 2 ATP-grasp protein n=1 Tax=Azohydromonas sediminis TaxID=2259674 RepID=UPI000E6507EA|nr:circularly permuted type 2 ATP-grasp protein [Azohydromonas sediminis]